MEKNMKKYIYVCITELLCCIAVKDNTVNQLYFNKIKSRTRLSDFMQN